MANETVIKPRRSKGDGSLFKNNKGRWVARFNQKGLPTREFTGKTKTKAKAKLDEYKFLIQTGESVNQKLTVAEYAIKFLYFKEQQVKRKKLKQSTYDRLEATFDCHIKNHYMSRILICNLRSRDIQTLLDDKQDHYSFSTIKKVYLFLHSMIKHGQAEKDLPESFDPFISVELPDESAVGVKTKDIEIIPDEYLDRIKEVALSHNPDGTLNYRYGPAIIFALNTGLREGELIALSKNGICKDKEGRISIRISETVSKVKNRDENAQTRYKDIITPPKYPRSNRTIPLNQDAVLCLNTMLNTYEPHKVRDDLIITTKTGNIPTLRNIQMTLDRILVKSGFKHCGTHALRHTFATRLLSKTSSHQDIKAVAELLGDDYKVILNTYLHTV